VYITFDNSDGRLPVEGAEVVVGRVVGIKKDEYFVGGKVGQRGQGTGGMTGQRGSRISARGQGRGVAECCCGRSS
jgi:hypothetical protein